MQNWGTGYLFVHIQHCDILLTNQLNISKTNFFFYFETYTPPIKEVLQKSPHKSPLCLSGLPHSHPSFTPYFWLSSCHTFPFLCPGLFKIYQFPIFKKSVCTYQSIFYHLSWKECKALFFFGQLAYVRCLILKKKITPSSPLLVFLASDGNWRF